MAVRRNHEHSHHCKTRRLSSPSPQSLLALQRVSSRSIPLPKGPLATRVGLHLPFRRQLRGRLERAKQRISTEVTRSASVGARIAESVGRWLRGLDSNQDIQLQRLACYRLHHPGPGHSVVTSVLETCHRATVSTRTSTIKARLSARLPRTCGPES